MNLLFQECQLIRQNLLKWMGMVLQLPITSMQIVLTFFALNLCRTLPKKTWNQMVINYLHLLTLSEM